MSDTILLIRPPGVMGNLTRISLNQHPINLLYLASTLLISGQFQVRIVDFEIKDYFCEELLSMIRELGPIVIGITAMTPTIVSAHKIAAQIKQEFPQLPIVIGGNHASALPLETLKEFASFDIAVSGEGEETFLELCNRIKTKTDLKGISGIVHRSNGEIIVEKERLLRENLDELPFPARHLLDLEKYSSSSRLGRPAGNKRTSVLFTSRGCPYDCVFCATKTIFSAKARVRSLSNIEEEVGECVRRYGIGHFTIQDDNFCLARERVFGLSAIFRRYQVTWDCDARVDAVGREMLKAMAASGCVQVSFGVESGNPRILELIRKHISLEKVENAFRFAKEAGIKTYAYFMLGLDFDETRQDVYTTEKFIRKINPDYLGVALMIPYPGTQIYQSMIKQNRLLHRDWPCYGSYTGYPPYRNKYFSPEELIRAQKRMLRNFYLRPAYVFKRLGEITSVEQGKYLVNSAIAALRYLYKHENFTH